MLRHRHLCRGWALSPSWDPIRKTHGLEPPVPSTISSHMRSFLDQCRFQERGCLWLIVCQSLGPLGLKSAQTALVGPRCILGIGPEALEEHGFPGLASNPMPGVPCANARRGPTSIPEEECLLASNPPFQLATGDRCVTNVPHIPMLIWCISGAFWSRELRPPSEVPLKRSAPGLTRCRCPQPERSQQNKHRTHPVLRGNRPPIHFGVTTP